MEPARRRSDAPGPRRDWRPGRRWGLFFIGLMFALGGYFVFSGFLLREILTPALRERLERELTAALHRPVEIRALAPSFLNGVKLEGVKVGRRAGDPADLLRAETVTVRFNLWQVLRTRDLVGNIQGIYFERPVLALAVDARGRWNIADLFVERPEGPPPPPAFHGIIGVRGGETRLVLAKSGGGSRVVRITSLDGRGELRAYPALKLALLATVDGFPVRLAGTYNAKLPAQTELALATGSLSAPQLAGYIKSYLPSAQKRSFQVHRGEVRAAVTVKGRQYVPASSASGVGRAFTYEASLFCRGLGGRIRGVPLPLSQVNGALKVTPAEVSTPGLRVVFGPRQEAQVAGRVFLGEPELDLRLNAEALPLRELLRSLRAWSVVDEALSGVEADGLAQVAATLRGPARHPVLQGTLSVQSGWLKHPALPAPVENLELKLAAAEIKVGEAAAPATRLMVERLAGSYQGSAFVVSEGEILDPFGKPTAQGKVTVERFQAQGLVFPRTTASLFYQTGRVEVKELMTTLAGGGVLSGEGEVVLGEKPLFAGALTATEVALAPLVGALWQGRAGPAPALRGSLQGKILFSGRGLTLAGLKATGALELRQGEIQGLPLETARAGFGVDEGTVTFDYLTFQPAAGGTLRGAGRWEAAGNGRLDLRLVGKGLALSPLLALSSSLPATEIGGRGNLLGTVSGTLTSPCFTGDVDLWGLTWRGQELGRLSGEVTADRKGLATEDLRLTRPGGGEHRLSGHVAWKKGGSPSVELWWRIRDEDLATLLPLTGQKIAGKGTLAGALTLKGPLRGLAAEGELRINRGSLAGQSFDQAQAQLRMQEGDLTLTEARLARNGSAVELKGTIARTGDLNLQVSAAEIKAADLSFLAQLAPAGVEGTFNLSGLLGGTLKAPVFTGEVRGEGIRLDRYRFTALMGQIRLTGQTLTLAPLTLTQELSSYVLSGEIELGKKPQIDLRARVDRGRLSELFALAGVATGERTEGEVTGFLHLWGEPRNPRGRAMLGVDHWQLGGVALTGDVDMTLADKIVHINRLRLAQGEGLLVATGTVGGTGKLALEARGTRFDLTAFRPLWPPAPEGAADFTATVGGTLAKPEIKAEIRLSGVKHENLSLDEIKGEILLQNAVLTVKNFTCRRGSDELRLDGLLPLTPQVLARVGLDGILQAAPAEEPLQFTVAMERGQLALATLFFSQLQGVKGYGTVDLALSGSITDPRLAGKILLEGVAFAHPALPAAVDALDGEIVFTPAAARVDLRGRWGGGPVRLQGSLGLAGLRPTTVALHLDGQEVRYDDGRFLEAVVSGNLDLTGPAATPLLAGSLDLSRAKVSWSKFGEGSILPWDPRLAVKLRTQDMAVFRNGEMIEAWFQGELAIGGTWRQMTASGELYSRQGTFSYLNTKFNITEATAEFRDYRGLSPLLTVKAETWADGARVFLNLEGPTDKLAMDLTSDPPLSQTEIVQRLGVLGRFERLVDVARGEADFNAIMQEELLRLLDTQVRSQFLGGIEESFRSALDLDEFRIEPKLLEPKQYLEIRLGKQVSEKAYLSYERTLLAEPRETWKLDYRLVPGLNLNTQVNEKQEVRLGLETRFRF